jgi:hypothetical protein
VGNTTEVSAQRANRRRGRRHYEDKYDKSSSGSSSSMRREISQRREQRATQARAQQARLAERSIAELGGMFTKMSTLISQQGEVLERIEDNVEAAGMDIDAGHDELVKVYGMTKDNRGLVLKVFGILFFLFDNFHEVVLNAIGCTPRSLGGGRGAFSSFRSAYRRSSGKHQCLAKR